MRPKWLAVRSTQASQLARSRASKADGDDARLVEIAKRGGELAGVAAAQAQAIALGVETTGHGEADPAIGTRHHDDAIFRRQHGGLSSAPARPPKGAGRPLGAASVVSAGTFISCAGDRRRRARRRSAAIRDRPSRQTGMTRGQRVWK